MEPKQVYIDQTIIVAFFQKTHIHHDKAVKVTALFLKEKAHYYCSFFGIREAIISLIRGLSSNTSENATNSEKIIINKVLEYIQKVGITIIFSHNDHIFAQILSVQSIYDVNFEIAMTTAIMLEHKLKYILTFDDNYNEVIHKNLIIKADLPVA